LIVLRLPARFPLRPLLALLLGVLHAISFRSDVGWVVEIVALAGLFALAEESAEWRSAGTLGMAFGLGWFVCGIYWIFISVHTYGQVAAPLAALATLLLAAYLSLYPALALALAAFWSRAIRAGPTFVAVVGPLWMFAELARGTFLTGFPWMGTGYAHVGGPLAGFAPLLGVYGTALSAALMAAALSWLARQGRSGNRRRRAGVLALLFGLPLCGMGLRQIDWSHPSGRPITVRLIQGNIPQDVKFDPSRFESTVATYLALIERKPADLIVLPETALPEFLNDVPDPVIDRLRHDAATSHAALAFGVPIADSPTVYTNSVIAFDPGRSGAQRYDKSHLVPFGEFVPFGFRWFVDLMHIPLGDFTGGSRDQKPLELAAQRVAFNICYEDLFGEVIVRQAAAANLLVNVSNVAWFGDSQALPQHLQLSRMRAIEAARPMLRATNTGMTAALDPKGQVLGVLRPYTTDSLDMSVQPVSGTTPYVAIGNLGPLMVGVLLLLLPAWSTLKAARASGRSGTG
jgi:apolipoprotein N-acyltransferase